MAKPAEFPNWATDGAPSAIDTPFASAPRIATGWEGGDVPSPKTQNGWQYWVAQWLDYLRQDLVEDVFPHEHVVVAGAPVIDVNSLAVTLPPGASIQLSIPVRTARQVINARFRHSDVDLNPNFGILRVQFGYARDGTTTALAAPVDFANSAGVWVWDATTAGLPYSHAADTDLLELLLQNSGAANLQVQKIEITQDFV